MMAFLRAWLLSLVSCALLVSIAEQLVPGGTMRRIVRFAGGLVILLALLQPLARLDLAPPGDALGSFHAASAALEQTLEQQQYDAFASRIAAQTRAYIEDKADGLGLAVRAVVTTQAVDGVPLPAAVTLYGRENAALGELIERELGIAKERQQWIEPEESGSAPP